MLSVAITGLGAVVAAPAASIEGGLGKWLVGGDSPPDVSSYFDELQLQTFDRTSQLVVVAAKLALEDAGGAPCEPSQLGICLGNTDGALGPQIALDRMVLTGGPQAVSGSLFPYGSFNAPAANAAVVLHAKGLNLTFATGSTAGTDACAEAARQIQGNCAGAILAGGVEAPGPDLRLWRDKLGLTAAIAEGAAVFTLESFDVAARRGARVYGRIVGAASNLADDESRASVERAASASARSALEEARTALRDVGLIVGEAALLTDLFDGHSVPTQSAESAFGETLSASGAFQIVLALLSLRHRTGAALCVSRSLEGVVSVLVITQ